MQLKKKKETNHRCQARTEWQAKNPTGKSSEFGCKREAVTKVDGRWACKQHSKKAPNGWNGKRET